MESQISEGLWWGWGNTESGLSTKKMNLKVGEGQRVSGMSYCQ
jgi:hypothetical protein